ncbi:myomegalin-like isoform X2 [Xyrauchen texanus]|uniref:myomegalin-like isoform X2 n=1 Tax=Xyrauchen texanus TaxID=154827 RepID=UPI002241C95B|nr:myomegalin-like isoform X2 [Xyrauchen texanus]
MDWTAGADDTNWAENERDFVVDEEGNVCRAAGHVTDYVNEDADKVPLQTHTLRQFEQHLNDLKKENFSLKLRIYFLEERIQQKFEESSDDVYRTNIELKVELESLKQQLLEKTLSTAESQTNHNEAELQEIQQVLQTNTQSLQECPFDHMSSLNEHPSVTMETLPEETSGNMSLEPEEERDRQRIEELTAAVCCKERVILELMEEKSQLTQRVRHMEEQLQQLSVSLMHKETDAQFYQDELSRERLRVQQEMQVRETVSITLIYRAQLKQHLLTNVYKCVCLCACV